MQTNVYALLETCKNCILPLNQNGDLYIRKDYLPDLYAVKGVAPTYTNRGIGGVFYDLTMNWWVYRRQAFKMDYGLAFDGNFSALNIIALNQRFLLEEAEMFKNWIDNVYPEEKTELVKR